MFNTFYCLYKSNHFEINQPKIKIKVIAVFKLKTICVQSIGFVQTFDDQLDIFLLRNRQEMK